MTDEMNTKNCPEYQSLIDYMSNINPRTFPKGLDIEIFTFKTLKKTWLLAKTKYDKEHVTPHMVRNKNILHYNFKNNNSNTLGRNNSNVLKQSKMQNELTTNSF